MLYDLSNALHSEQFKLRVNKLYESKAVVELTEKKPKRSLPQNNYLHLIISFFASQYGETADWVKREYYKKHCNADLFIATKVDKYTGKDTKYLRSSADLTVDEMTLSIERFRNWSAQEAGIYLPSANEESLLELAQDEVNRHRKFI